MVVTILKGDCRDVLRTLPDESVHCVVTSPPYWGLRDYGVSGQLGLESTLGEHLETMVDVFREVRRVLRSDGSLWLNYGDCYATHPNGRSAADIKAAGNDDRTFRDKPFSTIGPIATGTPLRAGRSANKGNIGSDGVRRNFAGQGYLKPKDLCMIPNRIAIALQDDGWWVRAECIWGKPNAMPDSSGRWRPATAHEKVWCLSKTSKMFYDKESVRQFRSSDEDAITYRGGSYVNGVPGPRIVTGNKKVEKQRGHSRRHAGFNDRWDNMSKDEQQANGRLLRNYEPNPFQIWHLATSAYPEAHFATFPPSLAEICIKAGCPADGTVLDPFGGSGTTGMVADRLGCNAILIELNPQYAAMAGRRIKDDAGMFSCVEAAE